jgi:hypothetical protein
MGQDTHVTHPISKFCCTSLPCALFALLYLFPWNLHFHAQLNEIFEPELEQLSLTVQFDPLG